MIKNLMKFPKQGKQRSLPSLVASLDRYFSLYIRMRDADSNGVCRCISCGRPFHWKAGDCGHYVSRDRKVVRWEPKNCNAQCQYCNRYRSGEQYLHGKAIDKKWGNGTADMLQVLGKQRGFKVSQLWVQIKIDEIKIKIKELEGVKGLV